MSEDHRPGAAVWIDHFVLPTNDVLRWKRFAEHALGGVDLHPGEQTDRIAFVQVGTHHNGGSLRAEQLPDPPQLGTGLPRYGFYVRPEDIDTHLRRFEELGVEATDPVHISTGGEDGTAVYFRDPDGNELELWAPRSLPPGAMESGNPTGLGRISHAVLESRDLDRSLDFHSRFLAVDPIYSADIPQEMVALRLAGGGRLLFQKIEADMPTRGGERSGVHAAFTVRDEEWDLVHERLWEGLPEAPREVADPRDSASEHQLHPAWTRQRGSMLRRGMALPRGYGFTDWDNNPFHYVRGVFAAGETAFYEVVPSLAE